LYKKNIHSFKDCEVKNMDGYKYIKKKKNHIFKDCKPYNYEHMVE
jgi:hypothetical protein